MTLNDVMRELEALGNEKTRAHNKKWGASDNQFGTPLGEIRKLAKKIKSNHALALELWETENIDARRLAILLMKPGALTSSELDRLVRSVRFTRVADWLNAYIVKNHRDRESLRQGWMVDQDPMAARAGWNLTAQRVARDPEGLELPALLDRIESEMGSAAPEVQWTMNSTLVEIGIHFPDHRNRALEIGESLGLYRDYPIVKGCTSPFAPIWINEMVSRQG